LVIIVVLLLFHASPALSANLPATAAEGNACYSLTDPFLVTITNSGLEPQILTVTVGSTVTWHNATANTETLRSGQAARLFLPFVVKVMKPGVRVARDSGALAALSEHVLTSTPVLSATIPPNGDYSYTFTDEGDFPYFVGLASAFAGQIAVEPLHFDFALSAWPATQPVTQGRSVAFAVALTGTLGQPQPVALNLGGLPGGATWSAAAPSIVPTTTT
jgi:plastocyanin